MGFGSLRALALELNQWAHGVEATVTRPAPEDTTPIETKVIWLTPLTQDEPSGLSVQRSEPILIMAISKADVPSVPTGTVIVAPPKDGDDDREWVVDGFDRVEADKVHVIVVESE